MSLPCIIVVLDPFPANVAGIFACWYEQLLNCTIAQVNQNSKFETVTTGTSETSENFWEAWKHGVHKVDVIRGMSEKVKSAYQGIALFAPEHSNFLFS